MISDRCLSFLHTHSKHPSVDPKIDESALQDASYRMKVRAILSHPLSVAVIACLFLNNRFLWLRTPHVITIANYSKAQQEQQQQQQ